MAIPEFWDDFVRVAKIAPVTWDEIMKRYGGRGGQTKVLLVLYETDGLTPIDVARKLRIAAPTVVKMASNMEGAGLITRRRDPRDRRRVHLYLTERGRTVKKPIEEELRRFQRRTTAGLTEEERRYLASAFAKMVRNLESRPVKGEQSGTRA
jgi:MarR family transcriptional regulator, organic hydroperoxide resistance regulator